MSVELKNKTKMNLFTPEAKLRNKNKFVVIIIIILATSMVVEITGQDNATTTSATQDSSPQPTTASTTANNGKNATNSSRLTLNVGLITPSVLTNLLSYAYVASASTMAIAEAKRRGYLPNVDVKLVLCFHIVYYKINYNYFI